MKLKIPDSHFGWFVSWDDKDVSRHYFFLSLHTKEPKASSRKTTLFEVGTDRELHPDESLAGRRRLVYVGWRRRNGKPGEWKFPKTKWVPLR